MQLNKPGVAALAVLGDSEGRVLLVDVVERCMYLPLGRQCHCQWLEGENFVQRSKILTEPRRERLIAPVTYAEQLFFGQNLRPEDWSQKRRHAEVVRASPA